ncbi:MAG: phosphatase PAP2 family protein [Thiogranum sp.]
MTVLAGLLVLASWAILTIPSHLTTDNLLGNLDLYLYHWLQSLRSPLGDRLMIITTEIGDGPVLYGFTLVLSLVLLARKRWRAAVHWLLTVVIVGLLTNALKHYTAVPRPPLLDNALMNYAFPSGHASLSVAVFGFLAVLLARELRSSWHWIPYSVAVFLVVAISFSRLYLGVHWLSDILAGWSLGLMWVALMGIAYRRHPAPAVSTRILAPVALVTLVLLTTLHSSQKLEQDLALYRPVAIAPVNVTKNDWLNGDWQLLPAYRDDLKGLHSQPLDIQWSGEQQAIAERLLADGWRRPSSPDLRSLLRLFNGDATVRELPVLPQVHRGESQQLLLVRDSDDTSRLLTLRLWETEYRLAEEQAPLWVGDVTWLKIEKSFRLFRFLRTERDFSGALDMFLQHLGVTGIHQVQRPVPYDTSSAIDWDGRVLLISGD